MWKQKQILYSIILAVFFSLVLLLVCAKPTLSLLLGHRVIEFQITSSSQTDYTPDIDDNIVVWESGPALGAKDIYGYNLISGTTFVISNKASHEAIAKVSGDWVVWIDDRVNVVAKNLETSEERTIVSDNSSWIHSVEIGGNYVVWTDDDIRLYHIPTQVITQVTDSGYNDEPAVDWPWVVWRHQNGGAHIWAYNISTTEALTVSFGMDENTPDVYSETVVWSESTPLPLGGRNIFGLDLTTSERFTVTLNSEFNNRPRIAGNIIVWSTYGSISGDNVYAYDIASGETITVATSATVDQAPSVSGNVVVWRRFDNEPNDWNVYGARIYSHMVFLPVVLRD